MMNAANGSAVRVSGLSKVFVDPTSGMTGGVREADFELARGSFFTMLGPSGCGKTTTLRCIAGLEHPDRGTIEVGDQTFVDSAKGHFLPANLRRIGMVFQSYAIWPHMTVFDNVAFPLTVAKDRKYSDEEKKQLVGEALERVSLAGFQTRPATRLSGGQQQRVALARAIVRHPILLLLDEPLSNLDAALRDEMRNELKRLQQQIGITTIYVTHDQAEALEMSDLLAVIDHGRIVQLDAPREVYARPKNMFVAKFVGSTNILNGTARENVQAGQVGKIDIGDGRSILGLFTAACDAGTAISVSLRPEALSLRRTGSAASSDNNVLPVRVQQCGFLGSLLKYRVSTGSQELQVISLPKGEIAANASAQLEFAPTDAVAIKE
jgi:iron(III) transport system ATP-binding protein